MRDLDQSRLNGAIHEQIRLNEEMDKEFDRESRRNDGKYFLPFIVVVIFFQPIAEEFIELYETVVGYGRSVLAIVGL